MDGAREWGRVDPDGTVWVRLPDGERAVGSFPGATEDEALAYFVRKYDELAGQVSLLEQRIAAGQVSAPAARASINRLVAAVGDAHAVGDLVSLQKRLADLAPAVERRREQAEQQRASERAKALLERQALVDEAEELAGADAERLPWKTSGDRLRELFETWRQMQREHRLDKASEDELWRRFSAARTTFDRKRRQHFGALDERRSAAKATKEAIVAEAERLRDQVLGDSGGGAGGQRDVDFGAGAAGFRDLMTRWKAAGRASRKDDDQLWARFRAAQDAFFAARNAVAAEADAELLANLEVKERLLTEAEALLPVRDHAAAKAALRRIQDRWDAVGKVPRADLGRIETRLRAVEQAVRDAEQSRWARSNPQARARAQDAVDQLKGALADLHDRREKARARGDAKVAAEAEAAIEARTQWLEQAQRTLNEFS